MPVKTAMPTTSTLCRTTESSFGLGRLHVASCPGQLSHRFEVKSTRRAQVGTSISEHLLASVWSSILLLSPVFFFLYL